MANTPTFVWDVDTNPIFVGDYVQCVIHDYSSIRFGERRRVKDITGGRITLRNGLSPIGTSDYVPRNFKLCGRHHPAHHNSDMFAQLSAIHNQQEKDKMLHIAMRIPEGWSYPSFAASITNWQSSPPGINNCEGKPVTHPDNLVADTSLPALKERVKAKIALDPDSRWLILSGNTIAETSAPPVVFRQW